MKYAFKIKLMVEFDDEFSMLKILNSELPKKLLERGIEVAEVVGSENEFVGILKEYEK